MMSKPERLVLLMPLEYNHSQLTTRRGNVYAETHFERQERDWGNMTLKQSWQTLNYEETVHVWRNLSDDFNK